MLLIFRRAVACSLRVRLAHVRALLRRSVIVRASEMIDARFRVDPDDGVSRAMRFRLGVGCKAASACRGCDAWLDCCCSRPWRRDGGSRWRGCRKSGWGDSGGWSCRRGGRKSRSRRCGAGSARGDVVGLLLPGGFDRSLARRVISVALLDRLHGAGRGCGGRRGGCGWRCGGGNDSRRVRTGSARRNIVGLCLP
jgi:hypothetical protein